MKVCRSCALLALVAGACTSFQDPTTVVDLRVLAVRVDPSEIILDADISDPANPTAANNPPVMVTPLIVDPAGGGRYVTYTISACPNDPFAPAAPGGGQGGGAFPSGGARTTVGSALCDEADPNTVSMTPQPVMVTSNPETGVPVTPSIKQLADAFRADIFPDQYGNVHGGFDLGMPLTLDIKVDAGTEQIRAVKRILYWARRIDDAQVPNELPRFDTVRAYYDRDPSTLDPVGGTEMIDPAPAMLEVRAGVGSIWIEPALATAESFETTVIDPDTHLAVPFTVPRETLRYRFFATAGSFVPAITSSEPETGFVATGPIHLESEYRLPSATQIAPDANGKAKVTIWIVVRDDRGGEWWEERTLVVTPL